MFHEDFLNFFEWHFKNCFENIEKTVFEKPLKNLWENVFLNISRKKIWETKTLLNFFFEIF